MKPRQAFDAEREEAAALPRPARRDPALAMAKRQVLVLLGAWLAVRALLMPAALLEYFSYGGGPAAYAALFLAGQAAQLGLLACLFFLPGAKRYFSVCGRNGKNAE